MPDSEHDRQERPSAVLDCAPGDPGLRAPVHALRPDLFFPDGNASGEPKCDRPGSDHLWRRADEGDYEQTGCDCIPHRTENDVSLAFRRQTG